MSSKEPIDDILPVMEILLTAEIFNTHQNLEINDLTPGCRALFDAGTNGNSRVKRPLVVSEGILQRVMGIRDAQLKIKENPFIAYEEFGHRLRITSLEPAAQWFLKNGGKSYVLKNPALAYFFESLDSGDVNYREVRKRNPRFEDTQTYLSTKVSKIVADSEEMRNARDLIIISAPEDVEYALDLLAVTPRQEEMVRKIGVALKNRDFLFERGIYEFGKLLFVGPPGTGKTSLALAMSRTLHMPVLEVRLAMITSQYLGETSKNIDRVFEIAKKISPCILFIDEFDFVARSRVSDDHGAMKRAVNMLLKNIDQISFVKNGVLLIAATNHPQILDGAAWRRFDEVVEFSLPDEAMRKEILIKITANLDCTVDFDRLSAETDGFSGADLRMMVKEAIISALMAERYTILDGDMEDGRRMVEKRDAIRNGRNT